MKYFTNILIKYIGHSVLIFLSITSVFCQNTRQVESTNKVKSALSGSDSEWEKLIPESEGGLVHDIIRVNNRLLISSYNELFESIDGGSTWTLILTSSSDLSYTDFRITESNNNILFGRKLSMDGGATWTTINLLPKNTALGNLNCHYLNNTDIYTTTSLYGIYKSTDFGNSFNPDNGGLPYYGGGYYPLNCINFYNGSPVTVIKGNVYTNNGYAWNKVNTSPFSSSAKSIDFVGTDWFIAINNAVYKSSDLGVTWNKLALPNINALAHLSYKINVIGSRLYASFDNDIYASDDHGITWSHFQLPDKNFINGVTEINNAIVAATITGIYKSDDGGISWHRSNKGFERMIYTSIEREGKNAIACTYPGGLISSGDNGISWKSFNNGLNSLFTKKASLSNHVYVFAKEYVHYNNSNYPQPAQNYKSNSSLDNWVFQSNFPVDRITEVQETLNGVYAIGTDKNSYSYLYFSNDGLTWSKISNGAVDGDVASVLIDQGEIYLGSNNSGIYKSIDNGSTWTPLSSSVSLGRVYQLKKIKNDLYALCDDGLDHSSDGGVTWTSMGLSSFADIGGFVSALKIINDNGKLIIGVYEYQSITKSYKIFLLISRDGMSLEKYGPDLAATGISFEKIGKYVYSGSIDGLYRIPFTIFDPSIYASSTTGTRNSEQLISIKADNFQNIVSSQFEVTWDPAIATFVDVENFGLNGMDQNSFGLTQVAAGKLIISWIEPGLVPQNLTDASSLFSIRFKLTGNYGASTAININNIELSEPGTPDYQQVDNVTSQSGTLTIDPTLLLTGKVLYPNNEAIQNVQVDLSGSSTQSVSTDNTGIYNITITPAALTESYILNPSKNNDPNPLNGIDVQDVASIRRHILKTQLFNSPYQIIAADVNQSSTVTTFDIVLVQALILGIKSNFPNNVQWTFVPSDFQFADANNPFPYPTGKILTPISSSNNDFIGIKYGDANLSRDNNQSGRQQIANVIFESGYPQEENGIVAIPIKVYGFNEVSAYQFTVKWDTENLSFIGIDNGNVVGEFGEHETANGILTTMWDNSEGKSTNLLDGSTLFTMKFRKKSETPKVQIEMNATTPAQVFGGSLNKLNFVVQQESEIPGTFEVGIYPNPFITSSQANIRLRLPEASLIEVEIITIDGRKIRRMLAECSIGTNILVWDGKDDVGSEVSSGVYLVKIMKGYISKVMKIMKN